MNDVDLGIKILATFIIATLDKMLVKIGEAGIGPRPATHPTITQVTMKYCCVYLVLLIILMTVFMKTKYVIVGVMVKEV